MSTNETEEQLRRATEDVLSAEKSLRELADKIKSYPEAAKRLQDVCDSLGHASNGIQSANLAMSNHVKAMEYATQRFDSAIQQIEAVRSAASAASEQSAKNLDEIKRDLGARIDGLIEHISTTHATTLTSTKSIFEAIERQAPLIERASGKRGLVF